MPRKPSEDSRAALCFEKITKKSDAVNNNLSQAKFLVRSILFALDDRKSLLFDADRAKSLAKFKNIPDHQDGENSHADRKMSQ